jgi:hypothetical protein
VVLYRSFVLVYGYGALLRHWTFACFPSGAALNHKTIF